MIAKILSVGTTGRLIALAILIALTWLAATQIPNLKIDRSDDKLISADDPGWPALRTMQEHFGEEQTVLIYIQDPESLAAREVTQAAAVLFRFRRSARGRFRLQPI